MDLHPATSGITWQLVVFCGLSLSVGWGIRGNFGHEYGAAGGAVRAPTRDAPTPPSRPGDPVPRIGNSMKKAAVFGRP